MKAMLKKAVKEQQHSIGKIIFGFSFVFVSKHDTLGGKATGNLVNTTTNSESELAVKQCYQTGCFLKDKN